MKRRYGKSLIKEKREEQVLNNIGIEKWKIHFMKLLEGMGKKGETSNKNIGLNGKEKVLRKDEIREAVMRMKQRKAVGIDEILMEAWR